MYFIFSTFLPFRSLNFYLLIFTCYCLQFCLLLLIFFTSILRSNFFFPSFLYIFDIFRQKEFILFALKIVTIYYFIFARFHSPFCDFIDRYILCCAIILSNDVNPKKKLYCLFIFFCYFQLLFVFNTQLDFLDGLCKWIMIYVIFVSNANMHIKFKFWSFFIHLLTVYCRVWI